MRYIFLGLFFFCAFNSFGQQYLDKKIIVTVDDTSGLYQKVRIAFGKHNFQIKEDGNSFVITTFPRELKKIPGYMIARAEINESVVTLTGIYGLIRIDDWGYSRTPNNYKNVLYMNGSKTWPLLLTIAKELGDNLSYAK